jgi:hypothetical protein
MLQCEEMEEEEENANNQDDSDVMADRSVDESDGEVATSSSSSSALKRMSIKANSSGPEQLGAKEVIQSTSQDHVYHVQPDNDALEHFVIYETEDHIITTVV